MTTRQVDLVDLPTRGPRWGPQGGLVSEAEISYLATVMHGYERVLEVGHYYGLSTAVLAAVCGQVTSIDAHIAAGGLEAPNAQQFYTNHRITFPTVQVLEVRSESVRAIRGFNAVFYDGDHEEEQYRWTQLVLASPDVELFVFDDRDMDWPALCAELLRGEGWRDESPPLVHTWEQKTTHPDTMTLAVFRRPERQ